MGISYECTDVPTQAVEAWWILNYTLGLPRSRVLERCIIPLLPTPGHPSECLAQVHASRLEPGGFSIALCSPQGHRLRDPIELYKMLRCPPDRSLAISLPLQLSDLLLPCRLPAQPSSRAAPLAWDAKLPLLLPEIILSIAPCWRHGPIQTLLPRQSIKSTAPEQCNIHCA